MEIVKTFKVIFRPSLIYILYLIQEHWASCWIGVPIVIVFVDISIRVWFIQSVLILPTKVAPYSLALRASHMRTSVIFSSFQVAIRTGLLLPFLKHRFKLLFYLFIFPAFKVIFMISCLLILFFIVIVAFFNFRYLFFAHTATYFHANTFLAEIEIHGMCLECDYIVRAERTRLYSFIWADIFNCNI